VLVLFLVSSSGKRETAGDLSVASPRSSLRDNGDFPLGKAWNPNRSICPPVLPRLRYIHIVGGTQSTFESLTSGLSRRGSIGTTNTPRYFARDINLATRINLISFGRIREDYREGRRAGRGVLVRGARAAQVMAQESVEEHIRGSVERLDNQFSTLHQDVATLSCEVRPMIANRTLDRSILSARDDSREAGGNGRKDSRDLILRD